MVSLSRLSNKIDAGLVIAAVLVLFAIQALFKPGLPTSADMAIHLYRTLEFEQALAPGVITPRWAPNLAFGYGYPLFIFAPPLPYILGMVLHGFGLNLENAFKALIVLTFLLYAVGMYLFVRDIFNNAMAGLVAATTFTFAPFALREALLEGGNIPQLLAIGLFPWPLWAITRAINKHSFAWATLAGIFYAAIMLSHLFQAFVYTPVFIGYTLLLVIINRKTETIQPSNSKFSFFIPLLAPALGLLLSAYFWLPAFIERNFTRAQADVYLEKSPFFIRYPYWLELTAWIPPLDARAANPYNPLTLGVVTLALAGFGLLAGVLIAWNLLKPSSHSPLVTRHSSLIALATIIFFAAVAAAAIFLTLPISRLVWETIEILQVAEFPWRMLGLANLGLAVLAGAAILLVPLNLNKVVAAILIALQLVAIGPYLYPVIPFTRYGQLTLADQINYERNSQSIGTTTLGEYLPQTVTRPPTTSPLVEELQTGTVPERLDYASLPPGAEATLIEQTAVTHRYQLNSSTPFTLRILQFNFPGWQAELDNQPVPIVPEDETGLILVNIPAGQHTLTLHFGETPTRAAATGVTTATIIGLVIAVIIIRKRRSPTENLQPSDNQTNPQLAMNLPAFVIAFGIVVAALWLKPLLKPIFNIESPRQSVLPAQHPLDIRFANNIRLVGYNLNTHTVAPGGYMQIVLYWQTDGAPHRVNLQPFVHLDRLDTFTTVADATNYTPGDGTTETVLPTFHWDNSRYVRDEHDLIVPLDTPPLAYALRVGLIDPDAGRQLVPLADASGDTAWIDTVNVSPASSQPVTLSYPLNVQFSNADDTIDLTGFEISGIDLAQLDFNLTWQSEHRPQADYTIFAQLLDSTQMLVTSFDGPPLDGAYPTSTWLPNQSILDPRYLPLQDVPAGEYTLIIGLYQPDTGQRLTTSSGSDYVELTKITIP